MNEYGQPVGEPLPGWTPRALPPRTPVSGRYCRLEPLDAARHGDALWEAYGGAPDGTLWTYLSAGPHAGRGAFDDYLARASASTDPLHHAVIDLRSGVAVGTLALMRIDPGNGVIEVGHVAFSPRLQRSPLSTEAQYLLMRRVFDELGYRRYEWKCDSLNAPSRAAAQRLGFRFEGIFRQAVVYKGRTRDTAWYSVIDSEWPGRRAAFEAWLAPANFDGQGRQRRRLAECAPGADGR